MSEDKNLGNSELNAADELTNAPQEQQPVEYTDDNIRHLSDMEHVRTRPGMYIGRLGDGNLPEDGIYVLLKEVVDNSIDEFKMGAGARLEIDIEDHLRVSVRDYGRGIPQGKLVEAVSVLNTGGKYDSKAFKKSVGLNGVGVKAVNALSSHFEVKSYRDGKVRHLKFEKGILKSDKTEDTEDENGTFIFFEPDNTLFKNYSFHDDFVETMLRNYTYLNTGLTIMHNGRRILSRHGLQDLLSDNMTNEGLYDIVHMKGEDIEIAFTHTNQYGEEYYSFVNGQHTTQGGTHQSAFKEHIAKTIKEFYGKYEYADIRNGLVAAIAINVEEPVFESQTKIKLGSTTMTPNGGETINKYVGDFLKKEVDNYLHIHKDVAEILENKIKESERERKAMAGVTKLARERAKKANLHNRKLRDWQNRPSDAKNEQKEASSIFITEGDSASGSITKSRDVNTQAVFSLRGKPLNSFGLTKKVVYENEEFNAAHPYYNAMCWAYQTRLLRQNDPNTEYDDKVDYQTACVLIRRYAIMAGVDTGVDQTQLRQLLRDAPDLGREAAKAMLWCDERDITTRDSSLDELLASAGTRISRYQMTSFLFYLCTYELDIGS